MAVKSTGQNDPPSEGPDGQHHRRAHPNRQAAHTAAPENAPVSTPHGIRPPSNRNHHDSFMQCRTCCNCNSQCSYYGKGHFDADGNYVG